MSISKKSLQRKSRRKRCFSITFPSVILTLLLNTVTYPQDVRVALLENAKKIDIRISSPYKITTPYTDELLGEGTYLKHTDVYPTMAGVRIGNTDYKIFGIRIKPEREPAMDIGDTRLRGSVEIIRQSNKRLLIINHLDSEEYLHSVVASEISADWPIEALKAQAIASRTYLTYHLLKNSDKDYDVKSSVYSMVYKGEKVEDRRVAAAVKETEGKIMLYDDKPLLAFFHGACGGWTENANQLWNLDFRYPIPKVKCDWCKKSPSYQWLRKVPLREIENLLERNGKYVGRIRSITPVGKTDSGRIKALKISHSNGNLTIPAKDFRLIVGPDTIRSTNFKVTIERGYAYFEGFGWGHGVGMCQWGAYYMADAGYKAEDILKFYYPGIEIKRAQYSFD